MGINPDFMNYRVGKIINFEIIQYLFENSEEMIFDFGSGRYPWKFEWTQNYKIVYELRYDNPSCKKLENREKMIELKRAAKRFVWG